MKVDKSNQCFFITPLLDTLSMKTFHQITGTVSALVILSARFMVLVEVDLVRKKGGERGKIHDRQSLLSIHQQQLDLVHKLLTKHTSSKSKNPASVIQN